MSRRNLTICLVAGSFAGCFYPGERGRQLETRVDKLSEDESKLAEQTRTQLDDLSKKSEAKISEMNKVLESLDRASRRSDADVGIQLQKVAEDVAALRGQVESYLFKINQLETALKALQDDTDKRFADLKSKEQKEKEAAEAKAKEMKRPADKKEFFQLAEDKAKSDPPLARELYNEFLKKWPKDDLVGDAHYGLGETWFVQDKCREAIAEYGKVIQDFSKSKSAPSAYLRTSDCFKKLKMDKESELALKELVRTYPKSDEAKKAKQRLEPEKKKGNR